MSLTINITKKLRSRHYLRLEAFDDNFKGENEGFFTALNASLATNRKLSEQDINGIFESHYNIYNIKDKMTKLSPNYNLKELLGLADDIQEEEFKLQAYWGFAVDANYHSHWIGMPHCTCPILDNEDRVGSGMNVYNANCPYHGSNKLN